MAGKKKLNKEDHAGMAKAAKVVKGIGAGIMLVVAIIPGVKHFGLTKFIKKS